MPYLTPQQIEREYPEHLDEYWDEYAPDSKLKSRKLWASRHKGMLRLASKKGSDSVTYYYRGFALSYEPDPEWERAEREDAAARGWKQSKRSVPPWLEVTGAGFGGYTAEEIKTQIDKRLDR